VLFNFDISKLREEVFTISLILSVSTCRAWNYIYL